MAITWDSGPVLFERDPRWRWRAQCLVVAGQPWPYQLEVRFKAKPCGHDAEAADWDDEGGRFPLKPCDCWDGLDAAPNVDDLPAGGLSARTLRDVRLGEVLDGLRRSVTNMHEHGALPTSGSPSAVAMVGLASEVLNAPAEQHFTERGPGRPSLPPETHLRRLAVLLDEYERGHTQKAAAKRLKVSEPTLRVSLEWARRQGLWSPAVNGRRGKPTEAGVEAIAPYRRTTRAGAK